MLHIATQQSARKNARSLVKGLKARGLDVSLGQALDVLSGMTGFRDWNGLSAALSPESIERQLHDFELSHMRDAGDVQYEDEEVIVAQSGFQLRFPIEDGGASYVRVCDPLGRELMYWNQDEWMDDPAIVMGAILRATLRDGVQPTEPSQSASRMSIGKVRFEHVDSVEINGERRHSVTVLSSPALSWALSKDNDEPVGGDLSGSEVLQFDAIEDGIVWEQVMTAKQLLSLLWDEDHRYFVDEDGDTYAFYYSTRVGD